MTIQIYAIGYVITLLATAIIVLIFKNISQANEIGELHTKIDKLYKEIETKEQSGQSFRKSYESLVGKFNSFLGADQTKLK